MPDLQTLAPDQLTPWPGLNPRQRFDEAKHRELVDSLKQHGNLQPVLVKLNDDEPHYIVAGERRWKAAAESDLPLLCLVREDLDLEHAIELAGIENLHRDDLTAVEEALWYRKLIEDAGKTQAEVAEIRGVDPSTVSNTLRLLELPEPIQALIEDGKLAATNARDFLLPWMKEEEKVRDRFFLIVAQQLEFGATMGQSMSKPWIKEMVEKVGTIAKPKPKPEPPKKAAPARKPKKAPASTKEPAPAEPPEADEETTPARKEGAPAPEEPEAATSPEPEPETTDEPPATEAAGGDDATTKPEPTARVLSLDQGLFGSLAQVLGERIHHVTLAIMPHPGGGGRFSVTLLPKNQKGMGVATGEVANGTAEELDDQVRAAALRFLNKTTTAAA